MAGLLDIGKLSRTITIRDQALSVEGLTAHGLFELLDQFPELRKVFSDAGVAVKPTQLMAQAPGAIITICVYVLGYRRKKSMADGLGTTTSSEIDAEFEAALVAAAGLTLGEQTEIIKTAWDLTFPKGLQSFLEALEAVGAIGSGWGQATASPGQSKNLSPVDTPSTVYGSTPPGNSVPM